MLALFITLGAVVVFLILNNTSGTAEPGEQIAQEAGTPTASPTITITPTITQTPTQAPSWTPLPPIPYTVKAGETCSDVAAAFGISIQSIILENNLTADCTLFEGDELSIPQPTPTASPQPTATLSDVEKTEIACEVLDYTVVSGDTLSTIADTYNISQTTIREYNSLPNDTVFEDMNLRIPLCEREPTPGPTPTPTQQPPYPGPNLLLPADGASFVGANSVITLQWAAVGEIEGDEAYAVTIVDLTSEDKTPVVDYVTDTSYIIPQSLAPTDGRPHVFRWSVFIARQIGGDEEDNQNWVSAGNLSIERVFSWYATGAAASTPTP
ncbi:MAG: LysM peptidoglycan-binding domain-containing protein [Chloroflexota bacterium]|nr:LysM peptidoglycan-binding domain-containing protein [Chloroflexota bacterium]